MVSASRRQGRCPDRFGRHTEVDWMRFERTSQARSSWRRFTAYVPALRAPGVAVLWLLSLLVGGALLVAGGGILARRLPYGALAWQAVLVAFLAWFAHAGFWRHRRAARAQYGEGAYQVLFFRYVYPALLLITATAWMPLAATSGPRLPQAAAVLLLGYLLTTAGLILARGRDLFWNIDLRAFIYSVYPERGALVRSPLFQQIRHPIYSAAVRAIACLALTRNNLEAFACAGLVGLAFRVWAWVEEGELMERFPSYAAYRAEVPALAVTRLGPWCRFLGFLVTGRSRAQPSSCPAEADPTAIGAASLAESRSA